MIERHRQNFTLRYLHNDFTPPMLTTNVSTQCFPLQVAGTNVNPQYYSNKQHVNTPGHLTVRP